MLRSSSIDEFGERRRQVMAHRFLVSQLHQCIALVFIEALKHTGSSPTQDGFIKVETTEDPKQLELDAAQVEQESPALKENYGISGLQRLK